MSISEQVSLVNADAAAYLAAAITGDKTSAWSQHVQRLLSDQNADTLSALMLDSAEFQKMHWHALDHAISDFVYGSPAIHATEPTIVSEDFFLRVAFALLPLVVEEHLPMLEQSPKLNWNGEYEGNTVDDVNQMASDAIHFLAADMVASDNQKPDLARGMYLHKTFMNHEEFPLSDETLLWLSKHAVSLLPYAMSVFDDKGDLDRARAEELVRVETPMLRVGVL